MTATLGDSSAFFAVPLVSIEGLELVRHYESIAPLLTASMAIGSEKTEKKGGEEKKETVDH